MEFERRKQNGGLMLEGHLRICDLFFAFRWGKLRRRPVLTSRQRGKEHRWLENAKEKSTVKRTSEAADRPP
jgi:hypothetical protein